MKFSAVIVIAASLITGTEAVAQRVATASLIFPNETGRTGVFRLPAGEKGLQVQMDARDAEGRLISGSRCPVTWKVGNRAVLTVERSEGASAWVNSLSDGITDLTGTLSCATSITRSVPVVVGAAAIETPIAPRVDSLDNFYPKTLSVTVPGWARVSGGKVFFRPIDTEIQFAASAYNGNATLITPQEFPMKWSVSNTSVLKIDKSYDHTAFFTPVGTGTTTVTFAVEGMKRSFDVTIQDQNPPTSDEHETLVLTDGTSTTSTLASTTLTRTAPIASGTITTRTSETETTASAPTATAIMASPPTIVATVDPLAVHATGFTAIAGYGNIELKWNAAPNAVGYRIARKVWDPAQQKFVDSGSKLIPSSAGTGAVASTSDLIPGTTYMDVSLDPRMQYVYVLSTYFKSAGGAYYQADAASEPRATATPKDPASVSWLPADWQTAPKLTNVKIVSQVPQAGLTQLEILVEWQPKGGAAGYLVTLVRKVGGARESKACQTQPSYAIQVAPTRPGTWYLTLGNKVQTSAKFDFPIDLTKYGIWETEASVCIQVFAVYPNKVNPATGTPDVLDAFYTESNGPGPESRFRPLPGAIFSLDAAAKFWTPTFSQNWEIVPQNLITRY